MKDGEKKQKAIKDVFKALGGMTVVDAREVLFHVDHAMAHVSKIDVDEVDSLRRFK